MPTRAYRRSALARYARRHARECKHWREYWAGRRFRKPRCSAEPRETLPEYLLPPVEPVGGKDWHGRYHELWHQGWWLRHLGQPFMGNLSAYLKTLSCAGCKRSDVLASWPLSRGDIVRLFAYCTACEAWVELA